MSHDNSQVYRTSPARAAKMMAIMLGICIVGGVIFFSMWDYWTSQPPPVVALMAGDSGAAGPAAHTGATIMSSLLFIESSDFRTLAFNALPGEPDNNPTINMEVGDKVVFDVVNDGRSFHAFGVTQDDEGFGGIIVGSDVASASNPLKSGEGGTSEFIAGEEGIFYYICTVPGHREQGMVGTIIVGDIIPETASELVVETAPVVESTPVEFSNVISLPKGSGVPGCDETNECYIPFNVSASVGQEITWSNDDSAAHTVTSGTPSNGPDGNFDSSLFMSGGTFSITLDASGEYPYFCMVHPWMVGNISVN
tara:strand:- start:397 stop:1323 length:927 start_codon:yes stop_codon:yes gene_type:complete